MAKLHIKEATCQVLMDPAKADPLGENALDVSGRIFW